MVDSPLKRKREGAEPLRKKVKSRRKSDAAQDKAEEDVKAQEFATPAKPKEIVANGVPAETATPSLSKSAKKRNKKNAGKDTPTQAPASTPASSGKKAKKGPSDTEKPNGVEPTPSKTPANKALALVKQDTESNVANTPKKSKKEKKKAGHNWTWSAQMGGWFLPEDPIFTSDEKYLLVGNAKALQVYPTDSSSLERALPVRSGYLSAYALSATQPTHIYTASAAGLITLADWTEGTTIGRWDIGTNVRSMSVVADPTSNMDLLFSYEMGSSHVVNVHALRTRQQAAQTELQQILKTKSPISGMRVLANGKILVLAFHKSIMIGRRARSSSNELKDLKYVWREFQTSRRVTCFDAYIRTAEQSSKSEGSGDSIDLAMGDSEGVIWLFEDILSALAKAEKAQKDGATDYELLRPKRLHWHREAVAAVKWSRDGNYLISGGAETVLVIWQLSTGKQQHLPHLTAAIENIVVSPSGASYSITLANNSVVVLSTTELEPKMNILGIQSRRVDLEQFPRETNLSSYSFGLFSEVPMAVNPKNTNQVLFSVPSSQPLHEITAIRPEPYMQTYDIVTGHTVSRQALTRNNATDPNMAPDGRKILEPDVTFIKVSSDGKWLATVDEWVPPRTDLRYIDEGVPELTEEERHFRREVYLKFWSWEETKSQWVLESRIDAPHWLESVGASGSVMDLVVDPAGTGFATVGEDRSVKIWRPKTRLRDGVIIRGDKNKDEAGALVTWSLYRAINLSRDLDVSGSAPSDSALHLPQHSRLAFSADGSVLVVGMSDTDSGVIHLIDATTGTIRRSITELEFTDLSSLGILDRYLVVLGRSIVVWDLVLDELVYCIPDGKWSSDHADKIPLVRLAINAESGTFAVAMPHFESNDAAKSRGTRYFMKASTTVSVFDPAHSRAISQSTTPNVILSLIPAKDSKGYIALDSSSSIKVLSPKAPTLQFPTPPPEPAPQRIEAKDESDMDVDEQEGDLLELLTGEDALRHLENDKPVVRPEQLQEVFDLGPSQALPPVKDLFEAVVGLYARKPRTIEAA